MKSTILLLAITFLGITSQGQRQAELAGHGSHEANKGICVTPDQRVAIASELSQSRKALIAEGVLGSINERGNNVLMNFPLAMSPVSDWRSGYAISGYVDQDGSSDAQSHNCDTRTYDGHMGTDYYSWPFGGYLMETEQLHVVAAASGTIIYKSDGEFDQQCEWQTGVTWNAVYVEHSDGTIAWYGHMKQGTLTTKAVGQAVAEGEYIGVVGSSGYSSGPHLHFELHNADGSLIDPYFAECNNTDLASTWANQPPYWEMELNTLLTHNAAPEFGCPAANEEPNIHEYFNSFETVYLASYFKEQSNGAQVEYRIRMPNGTVTDSWTQQMDADYESSYWYWAFQVPLGEVDGTWTWEADYGQETFVREFYVNDEASGLFDQQSESIELFPNPSQSSLSITLPTVLDHDNAIEVQIIDAMGRPIQKMILQSIDQKNLTIDISALSSGLYLLNLQSEEALFSSQFIKN